MYASVIEKIESVSLQAYRSVIDGSEDNFSLWYTSLKQSIINCDGYAIFTAINQIRRYLGFKRKMTHFMVGYQIIVYPLEHKKNTKGTYVYVCIITKRYTYLYVAGEVRRVCGVGFAQTMSALHTAAWESSKK